MKTIIILLAISFVAVLGELTDEDKAKWRQYKEECMTETGVDPTIVEKAKKGEIVDSEELKCHRTCMLKKFGSMTENGDINWEVIRAKVPNMSQDKFDEMKNACEDIPGTGCEKGSNLMNCLKQYKNVD